MTKELKLGDIISDRYELIQNLGEGSFGTTFIAEDTQLPGNPRCVVKQLTPKDNSNLEIATRLFRSEAEILQKLGEHPQIPRLLAYIQENGEFYLVQELIEGDTLAEEFVEENLPFSEKRVMRLVRDILGVLVFVQKHNHIHRDIKPSNLIRRASDGKIVLIDFGAVKEKINTEIIDAQEKPTVQIGTKGYMPIEQMRGFPCFQSDLYAVGMLAIYGLTGISPSSLTDRDGQVNWRNYLAKDKKYNRSFLGFLDKLVRSNYRDRYTSAAEALDYLDKLETPTIEKPGTSSELPKKTQLPLLKILGALAIIGLPSIWLFNLITQEKFVEYQNLNYGIQVDRPEDWKIEEKNDVFEKVVIFKSPLENKNDNFQEKVSISIEDLSSQPKSLAEYSNATIQNLKQDWQPEELQESETNLADRPADRVIYSYRDGDRKLKRMQVWNLKNNRAYVVTYTAEEDKFDRFSKSAEKIIDSLKID
jgi:eukaryotic-like serine/threonine-protein kinase